MRVCLSFLLVASLLGCDDGGVSTGTPAAPGNLDASGSYLLASRVDVPSTVLASQSVVDYLALLRQLRTDPAAAFFTLLEDAGVPMASELRSVLPSVLTKPLEDAINGYVGGQTGGAAGAEIDRILALSEAAFAHFSLASRLDVPAGAKPGPAVGSHAVQGLVLDLPGGAQVTVPDSVLAALAPMPATLVAAPTVAVGAAAPGAGDLALVVGDHFFGLAYGEVVFTVLDGYGTGLSLRSRLGAAYDCAGMGAWVAQRCTLGLCIGHASEVTELCEGALDAAVAELHDQLAGLRFEAIRFALGRGSLWDRAASEAADGLVSRLEDGVWQASIDLGTGPRDCRANFTGRR